jgi:formylglycine-generating enzyme required for sulfatase activity
MKKHYIIILLILAVGYLFSASPSVTNVVVTPESGRVVINYDLTADAECQITVLVSADSGAVYNIFPEALTGDIGDSVTAGLNKEIIWNPASDNVEVGDQYKIKVVARDNPVTPTNPLGAEEIASMVRIEGGTFNNGTADVEISDFYMGKYEVTQAEYEAVMNNNPSYFSGDNNPVEQVTWNNAVQYCNTRSLQEGLIPCYDTTDWSCDFTANGYRLPTEMEWMYAAKGGNEEPATGYNQYAGTNDVNQLTNYAWYIANNGSYDTELYGTKEVGTKLPNQIGLYDMSGNVWEWCNDWYGDYSSLPQIDPLGPTLGTNRVSRGGDWSTDYYSCQVAFRVSANPTYNSSVSGFRLARSIEESQPQLTEFILVDGGSFNNGTADNLAETNKLEQEYLGVSGVPLAEIITQMRMIRSIMKMVEEEKIGNLN